MIEKNDILNFIDPSRYKSVLCLNGDLPSTDFFKSCGLPIIAADGAANKLNEHRITPNFIIGDCDSVNPSLLQKVPHLKVLDQNYSDFQKAIRYIENNQLAPSIICGISGNYLDHIINNIGIFMQVNPENVFIDNEIIGFNLYQNHEFKFPIDSKISILGMPHCNISTTGMKWELLDLELSFPGYTSCFNRNVLSDIYIEIHKGRALMIVYRNTVSDAGLDENDNHIDI